MLRTLFALSVLLLSLSVLQAQPINSFMIDNFNTTNGVAADNILDNQGVWTGLNPGSSVLGNHRIIGNYLTEVTVGNPPGPYTNSARVESSVFSVNNPFDTKSVGQIIWQGSSVVPNTDAIIAHPANFNLGNVDFNSLLSTPAFNFQWSVINADGRHWKYLIRAYTNDASNYFEGVVISNQSGVVLSIDKLSFTTVGNPSWSDIDALSFSASCPDGVLGGDLAFDCIQLAVPEVGSFLLLGSTSLVVGGYCLFRKRKISQPLNA